MQEYVVVGHCCESGDVMMTKLYDQETMESIKLATVSVGDVLVVEWTGAYIPIRKWFSGFPDFFICCGTYREVYRKVKTKTVLAALRKTRNRKTKIYWV